jgi:hypothetical protein
VADRILRYGASVTSNGDDAGRRGGADDPAEGVFDDFDERRFIEKAPLAITSTADERGHHDMIARSAIGKDGRRPEAPENAYTLTGRGEKSEAAEWVLDLAAVPAEADASERRSLKLVERTSGVWR